MWNLKTTTNYESNRKEAGSQIQGIDCGDQGEGAEGTDGWGRGRHTVLVSDRLEEAFSNRGIPPRWCNNCNWKVTFQNCKRNQKEKQKKKPKTRYKTQFFWLPDFTPLGKPAHLFKAPFQYLLTCLAELTE